MRSLPEAAVPAAAKQVLEQYEQRINRHDFDLLADLIAPDAVFWFSDSTHGGIDAIRAAFEATWRTLANDSYWLDGKRWIAGGSTAATCIYSFSWETVIDVRQRSRHHRAQRRLGPLADRP